MEKISEHIAALIIHAGKELSDEQPLFRDELDEIFFSIYNVKFDESDVTAAISILSELGGLEIVDGGIAGDVISLSVERIQRYYPPNEIKPSDRTTTSYDYLHSVANNNYKILKAYHIGGQRWIDRVLYKLRHDNAYGNGAPASDRMVPLNHNAPEYIEIRAGIADLTDQIREWNGDPDNPDERSRLLHGLEAAQRLWEATQLEYMQIKVGVIMAVEAVGPRLEALGKGVGWKLLIDAIKGFLKHYANIDLDLQ